MNKTTAASSMPVVTAPVQSWRAVGASVRGVSHERMGLPCQDAQDFRVLPNGALIIAVADGAGSARYAEQGAQIAVAEALVMMESRLRDELPASQITWEEILQDSFIAAREAVLALVEAANAAALAEAKAAAIAGNKDPGDSARDYACTLTCAAVTDRWLAVGQVGDGAVVAADPDGSLFAATQLQRGEYANETHFLTQTDAMEQVVMQIHERQVSSLAVMSDGLIRLALKLPAQEPHTPFFQPLLRFVASVEDEAEAARQLTGFLSSARVNERTDDDKSLVLAVRVEAQESPPVLEQESSSTAERGLAETDSPSLERNVE